jgi:hypothetical protein
MDDSGRLMLCTAQAIGHDRLFFCIAGGSGFFTGLCLWKVAVCLWRDWRVFR